MTIHLCTFSDDSMSRSRELCASSALANGGDEQWQYEQRTMWASRHVKAHPEIFRQPEDARRAWAWWAWKPVIIEDAMRRVIECYTGEQYVVYSDAGIEFIAPVSHIIERMDQDIFLFGNNWEHAHWCKGDIAYTCWPDNYGGEAGSVANVWGRYGKQVQASVIFLRVTEFSLTFVKEWLKWCLFEGGRLIDDSPSHYNNHPEFRENRHDQAILTTLAYREGLRLHWWGARYNMDRVDGGFVYPKLPEYASDDYEPFVHHHRRRNHECENAA